MPENKTTTNSESASVSGTEKIFRSESVSGTGENFRSGSVSGTEEIFPSGSVSEREKLIEVRDLSYAYPDQPALSVLSHMNLSVVRGECLAILGESGSGKSTLLKLMCGLLKAKSGRIIYDGRPLDGPDDGITMIFQNYGLFPWKNVRDNIKLPLLLHKDKTDEKKIDELLDYLGLASHAGKYPGELSGGQKQRVALGRAVVGHAKLILMDEPFSALDIKNRERLQKFMKKFLADLNMTAVIVTHSIEEALVMGDRIAIFDPQAGSIKKVLDNVAGKSLDPDSPEYYERVRQLKLLMKEDEQEEGQEKKQDLMPDNFAGNKKSPGKEGMPGLMPDNFAGNKKSPGQEAKAEAEDEA